jgi:hypothetical protein
MKKLKYVNQRCAKGHRLAVGDRLYESTLKIEFKLVEIGGKYYAVTPLRRLLREGYVKRYTVREAKGNL